MDIRDTLRHVGVRSSPILSRYSIYVEKEDTPGVQALRDLTPGTPEEGADAYAEKSCIGFYRPGHQYDLRRTSGWHMRVYD